MKKTSFLIILFLLLFPALANAKVTISATSAQNTALTLYNTGSALVYEDFHVFVPHRENLLEITGLPATIEKDSINIIEFKTFKVMSYSFIPPNLSRREILKRYLNKKIKLVRWDKEKNTPTYYDAILLGGQPGEFYYKVDNKIFLDPPGSIVIPGIPAGLHKNGILRVEYKIAVDTDSVLPIVYLTSGINWEGSYILTLLDEHRATLKCFARIENQSGRAFRDADVTLIAGSLHREAPSEGVTRAALKSMTLESRPIAKQTFEYHEYHLPEKLTLEDRQTREVSLFGAENLIYKKEYMVQTSVSVYPTFIALQKNIPVEVYINFKNTKDNHLGIPMPEGLVRIYSLQKRRHPMFLGSDRIEHTPEDEDVRLFAGEAFDIKVKKRQTDYIRVSRSVYEAAYEISLSNHKRQDVRVKVIENLSGQWKIISSSHKYRKLDANRVEFSPIVPAGTKVSIKYRVRISQ